ncbi:MAG: biotin/lipoyl-binding protein, partial [Deltaproteobacteria bacterium]|nr:biotin/lipoyl-binding protein [Deltaproteobacteria bacterium]
MKRKAIIITIIIALVATGAFAATTIPSDDTESKGIEDGAEDASELGTTEIKPINVQTATASTESLTEVVTATGTASPKTEVTFSAEIPGRIEYLGVELGQRVKKGQVLARIDTRTLRAQQTQAKANYELAKTTHGRLENLGA